MGARPQTFETKFLNEKNKIINEEVNNFLIEILNVPIETEYKEINKTYYEIPLTTYRFRTNSGNSYDLEFYYSDFDDEEVILNDGTEIKSGVDIGFTTTNRIKNNADDNTYVKRTRNDEAFELYSKIIFLLKEFVNKNPNINCYIVGIDDPYLEKIYMKIYENVFKNNFNIYYSYNPNYPSEVAYYFVKK